MLTEIIDGVEVTYYLLPVNKYDFDKNPEAAKLLFTYGSKDYFKIPVAAREVPKDTPNSSTVVRSNITLTNEQIQQTVDGVLAAMAAAEAAARAAAEARARARRRARAEQKAKEEAEAQYWAERNAWRQEQNAIRRQKSAAANALRAEQDAKAAAAAAAKQLAETYDRIDRERELGRQSRQAQAEKAAAAAIAAEKQAKIRSGVLTALSGLLLVASIATGGLTTPLLVVVGAAAATTVVYGVSEVVEGTNANGYNPLRDGVLGGSQTAYNIGKNVTQGITTGYGLASTAQAIGNAAQTVRAPVKQNLPSAAFESWYKSDGSIAYPPNFGRLSGSEKIVTIDAGKSLGRYGEVLPTSKYVTEAGASPAQLSLPPDTNPNLYAEISVLKPIPGAVQSTIAPYAGSPGMGLQYELPNTLVNLESLEIIKIIKHY